MSRVICHKSVTDGHKLMNPMNNLIKVDPQIDIATWPFDRPFLVCFRSSFGDRSSHIFNPDGKSKSKLEGLLVLAR